jgi:hypothetical protein
LIIYWFINPIYLISRIYWLFKAYLLGIQVQIFYWCIQLRIFTGVFRLADWLIYWCILVNWIDYLLAYTGQLIYLFTGVFWLTEMLIHWCTQVNWLAHLGTGLFWLTESIGRIFSNTDFCTNFLCMMGLTFEWNFIGKM